MILYFMHAYLLNNSHMLYNTKYCNCAEPWFLYIAVQFSGSHQINVDWSVKGYHVFQIRPPSGVNLIVSKESGNLYDPNAMTVTMPSLQDIPHQLHNMITRERRGSKAQQTVAGNASKMVGRVPTNLCRTFRLLIDTGLTQKITCQYSGSVGPTTNPHMAKKI